MDEHFASLIQKHATQGILLDSNILLLYLIGALDPTRIEKFKRTDQFTKNDFDLLCRLVKPFKKIISTPHILTEVSNLSGNLKGPEKTRFFTLFAETIKIFDDRSISSQHIASQNSFITHGITDSAVEYIAQENHLVMTTDLQLYLLLANAELDVINFNHIRQITM